MFPVPWPIVLMVVFAATAVLAVLLLLICIAWNKAFGRKPGFGLKSSIAIGIAVFLICCAINLVMPGELHWVNVEAQNLRTLIFDYAALISFIVAVVSVSLWQNVIIRQSVGR